MKRLIKSILLSIIIAAALLLLAGCDDIIIPTPTAPVSTEEPTPTAPTEPLPTEEPDDFKTAFRFIVASDVHIDDSGSELEEARLAKLFSVGYDYSARQKAHTTLDGVFFAGDCANNGSFTAMQKFFAIVNENARPETTVHAVTGNHEYYNNALALNSFKKASGYDKLDVHLKLNGFHVILLNTYESGNGFTDAQKQWLNTEIKKAIKDDPTKSRPVFVIQHQAPTNTAYGTEKWGVDDLTSVLKKYPQVVDLGGHSHFPINDPRSVWQGDFTVLNTGGLSYYEMGIVGVAEDNIFPIGTEGDYGRGATARDQAQFYIIEVAEDGRMRVLGYDLLSDSIIVSYDLGPFNSKDNFKYTRENQLKNAETPCFPQSTEVKAKYIDDSEAEFSFTQAQCRDTVQHYRCELYKDGELIKSEIRLSNNWYFPMPEKLSLCFDGLDASTDYTVNIIAVSAFGLESEPCTVSFATKEEGTATELTGEKIFELAFDADGIAFDGVSGTALVPCGKPVVLPNAQYGAVGVYMDGSSYYKFDGYSEHYGEIKKSVSFEFFGRLDELAAENAEYSDVLSNQQSGGCGIEITKDGCAQFYIRINGEAYYPQTKIETGEYVHIVGTYNGREAKLYLNGELADSVAVKGSMTMPATAQYLVVGGDSVSNNTAEALMKGEIIAANIYSYALNADEVAASCAQYAA